MQYRKTELSSKWCLIFVATLCLACKTKNDTDSSTSNNLEAKSGDVIILSTIPYDLSTPDDLFTLDAQLAEISGLTFDTISGMLMAVNDEKGKLYHVNREDGRIVNIEKFSKKGDYEGLATRAETSYIIESNGRLSIYDRQSNELDRQKTGLSAQHDVEGLALLDDSSLLVACKRTKEKDKQDYRQIYSYDLETNKLSDDPYLSISIAELVESVASDDLNVFATKALQSRAKDFSPSGIAVHNSGDLYVLSARGSSLAVYRGKQLEELIFLNEKVQQQPEGICFDDDGSLYIANEGKGLSARIFVYEQKG